MEEVTGLMFKIKTSSHENSVKDLNNRTIDWKNSLLFILILNTLFQCMLSFKTALPPKDTNNQD